MKKMMLIPGLFIFAACSSPELTDQNVLSILKDEGVYPRAAEYYMNLADPDVARRASKAGLEEQGLVQIRKSWTMANQSDPHITFTEKARPYLLGTPEGEDSTKMRIVLMSNRKIEEITNIEKTDDKHAVASFTVRITDTTPFQRLSDKDIAVLQKDYAEFELVGGKWQLHKRSKN